MRTRTAFPVAWICAAALTAGCSSEPMTERELDELRSFGPGLQQVAENLADTSEALGDAVCRIGRWTAPRPHKKALARRCPSPKRHQR